MIPTMISQRIKKRDQGAGLPIGGATAPEEGGKGSELGEVNVSVGSSSSTGEEGEKRGASLSTHVPAAALYTQI